MRSLLDLEADVEKLRNNSEVLREELLAVNGLVTHNGCQVAGLIAAFLPVLKFLESVHTAEDLQDLQDAAVIAAQGLADVADAQINEMEAKKL